MKMLLSEAYMGMNFALNHLPMYTKVFQFNQKHALAKQSRADRKMCALPASLKSYF
jgi:hypothetical protein